MPANFSGISKTRNFAPGQERAVSHNEIYRTSLYDAIVKPRASIRLEPRRARVAKRNEGTDEAKAITAR